MRRIANILRLSSVITWILILSVHTLSYSNTSNPYSSSVVSGSGNYSDALKCTVTKKSGYYHYVYTLTFSNSYRSRPLTNFSVLNAKNYHFVNAGNDHGMVNPIFGFTSSTSILWTSSIGVPVGHTVKFWFDSYCSYGQVLVTLQGGMIASGKTLGLSTLAVGGNPPVRADKKSVILLVRGLRPRRNPVDGDEKQYWSSYYSDANDTYFQEALPWAGIDVVGNDCYDGMGHIEDAATKLKKVVDDYINEGNNIYIVAHSMGGLVARSCLSKISSQRRKSVKRVIMLSTPNCGSHFAEWVLNSYNPVALFGPEVPFFTDLWTNLRRFDAVYDLQTDSVLKAREQWNDGEAVYYLFGGSDPGTEKKWTYPASKIYNWPKGTTNENDGIVTYLSAWGYCYHWKNDEPIAVGTLRRSHKYVYSLNHDQMTTDESVMQKVIDIINEASGNTTKSLNAPLPTTLSLGISEQAATLLLYSDTIGNGQINQLDFPVDNLSKIEFRLGHMDADVTFSLTQPDGIVLTPTNPGSAVYSSTSDNGITFKSYEIAAPIAGHWKLVVTGATTGAPMDYTLSADGNGALQLVPLTEKIQSGGISCLTAKISDGQNIATGATVAARVKTPDGLLESVILLDDGTHGDQQANDGIYGAELPTLAFGDYSMMIEARGSFLGNDFARLEQDSFSVSPASANLNGQYTNLCIDEDGNTGFEKLRVNVGLDITSGTSYRVYGEVADNAGNIVASTSTERRDLVAGGNTMALDFNGDTIRKCGVTGTLNLTNVSITKIDSDPELKVLEAENVYSFGAPSPNSFADTTPPSPIGDLEVVSKTGDSVSLQWTSPDSEGSSASSYELRWSNDGFSDATWTEGVIVSGVPVPAVPGSVQSTTISGLTPGKYYWFSIRSVDSCGNLSDLSNLCFADIPINYVPSLPIGSRATMRGVVVGSFPGIAYVERSDRAQGIAVSLIDGDALPTNTDVEVAGDVVDINGVRELSNYVVRLIGTIPEANMPKPLGMSCRLLGRTTLSNTGLIVKIWGKVTYSGSEFIYIDDGSGFCDGNKLGAGGSSVSGTRVLLASGTAIYPKDSYVYVSGVSGHDFVEGVSVPALRMRDKADIK